MASIRQSCETRLASMKSVREDYERDWRDIAKLTQPARSRFLMDKRTKNKGRRRATNNLQDSHGISAFRTLAHGMTSGLSSSSRPWFSLTMEDDATSESPEVRAWLSDVERRMYRFMGNTNFYSAMKAGYAELGMFGTEACVALDNDTVGAVFHSLTAGEYWIACGDTLSPDTLYRDCTMTTRQAVNMFGDKVSSPVRANYDKGNYEEPVEVYHAIEPDPSYDPSNPLSRPWREVYWETAAPRDDILREGGFYEQPFWAPRWDTCGGDVYGFSPGMEALPDLRELQLQVKRRNEAIDLMVHPEKIVPPGVKITGQPRSVVSAANVDKDGILVPYQMPYQAVAAISGEVDKCKRAIDAMSFADLFNAITNMQGIQPRNMEEIASRNEEKLTQLGPVIERVGNEKLEVSIDRVFGIMSRGNLLPPAPEELQGMPLKVEFVSILTQMQRMVGIGQIERTVGFVGNMAAQFPEAADKLVVDEIIDEYAYRAGSPAKVIRSTDEANKIRQERAKQMQQQQAMEAMPAMQKGADAARLLSEADTGGGQNLLQQLMPS